MHPQSMSSATREFQELAVARDGTVVAISDAGQVLTWDGRDRQWTALAGDWPVARHVAAGSAADVWVLDEAGAVYRRSESGDCERVPGELIAISAASDGSVWGVDRAGHVLRHGLVGDAWEVVAAPAPVRTLAVGGADTVVTLDEQGGLDVLTAGDTWQSRAGGPFSGISTTHDGLIIAVQPDGRAVFTVPGSDSWIDLIDTVASVQASGNGEVWAVDTDHHALDLTAGQSLFTETAPHRLPGGLGWDAQDVFDDTKSTHLWILNRAARLAALYTDPTGRQICDLVQPGRGKIDDPFHDRLCQGLYDADYVDPYNGPLSTYAGHFYDPDTGLNWLNSRFNTAFTNCQDHGQAAAKHWVRADANGHPRVVSAAERGSAGYELGLALHYLTDLTQPMHACNFTQLSSHPINWYHGAVETFAMEHQASVSPPAGFSSPNGPRGLACPHRDTDGCSAAACCDLGLYAKMAARNSKDLHAPTLIDVAGSQYYGWDRDPTYWAGVVNKRLVPMLQDAIRVTAQFLVGWMELAKQGSDWFDNYGPVWKVVPGYLTQISATGDGKVWGVGRRYPAASENVFQWTGSGWQARPGHMTQVAVSACGDVWGINAQLFSGDSNVFRWNGSGWELMNGYLTSIAVSPTGDVWGVNANMVTTVNNVFHWTGGGWQAKAGYLTDVAIGSDGVLIGVNIGPDRGRALSNVFRSVGEGWELVGGRFLTSVSCGADGSLWGVDATQLAGERNVYEWTGDHWETHDAFLTQLAVEKAGKVWGVNTDHHYGTEPLPNIYHREV